MNLTKPVDIEEALRLDVGPHLAGVTVCGSPAPDDLAPLTVCFESIGGGAQSDVSYEHGLVAYAWSATPAEALSLALDVCGLLGSLPFRAAPSGVIYTTCEADVPYPDPDPDRPTIPRATVRATIGVRGIPINID